MKLRAWNIAGSVLLGMFLAHAAGDDRAEQLLRESLEEARGLGDAGAMASIDNDLGNLLAAQGRRGDAARAYEESAEKAADPVLKAKAYANLAATATDSDTSGQANR